MPSRLTIERLCLKAIPGKAAGLDAVDAALLKRYASQVGLSLTELFMKIWILGSEPVAWKGELLCPIWKSKGQKQDPAAYRHSAAPSVGKEVARTLEAGTATSRIGGQDSARSLAGLQANSLASPPAGPQLFQHCAFSWFEWVGRPRSLGCCALPLPWASHPWFLFWFFPHCCHCLPAINFSSLYLGCVWCKESFFAHWASICSLGDVVERSWCSLLLSTDRCLRSLLCHVGDLGSAMVVMHLWDYWGVGVPSCGDPLSPIYTHMHIY